jgi:hypothetical protein
VKRLFWLGVGVAVGALIVRQVGKTVQQYAPEALARSAGKSAASLWASVGDFSGRATQWVGDFVADVREGMAEREEQIHAAFARGESLADLDDDDRDDDDDWDR